MKPQTAVAPWGTPHVGSASEMLYTLLSDAEVAAARAAGVRSASAARASGLREYDLPTLAARVLVDSLGPLAARVAEHTGLAPLPARALRIDRAVLLLGIAESTGVEPAQLIQGAPAPPDFYWFGETESTSSEDQGATAQAIAASESVPVLTRLPTLGAFFKRVQRAVGASTRVSRSAWLAVAQAVFELTPQIESEVVSSVAAAMCRPAAVAAPLRVLIAEERRRIATDAAYADALALDWALALRRLRFALPRVELVFTESASAGASSGASARGGSLTRPAASKRAEPAVRALATAEAPRAAKGVPTQRLVLYEIEMRYVAPPPEPAPKAPEPVRLRTRWSRSRGAGRDASSLGAEQQDDDDDDDEDDDSDNSDSDYNDDSDDSGDELDATLALAPFIAPAPAPLVAPAAETPPQQRAPAPEAPQATRPPVGVRTLTGRRLVFADDEAPSSSASDGMLGADSADSLSEALVERAKPSRAAIVALAADPTLRKFAAALGLPRADVLLVAKLYLLAHYARERKDKSVDTLLRTHAPKKLHAMRARVVDARDKSGAPDAATRNALLSLYSGIGGTPCAGVERFSAFLARVQPGDAPATPDEQLRRYVIFYASPNLDAWHTHYGVARPKCERALADYKRQNPEMDTRVHDILLHLAPEQPLGAEAVCF